MAEGRIRFQNSVHSANTPREDLGPRGWQLGGYTISMTEPSVVSEEKTESAHKIRPQFIIFAAIALMLLLAYRLTDSKTTVSNMENRVDTVRTAYIEYLNKQRGMIGEGEIARRTTSAGEMFTRIINASQLYDDASVLRESMNLLDFDHDTNSPLYQFGLQLHKEFEE